MRAVRAVNVLIGLGRRMFSPKYLWRKHSSLAVLLKYTFIYYNETKWVSHITMLPYLSSYLSLFVVYIPQVLACKATMSAVQAYHRACHVLHESSTVLGQCTPVVCHADGTSPSRLSPTSFFGFLSSTPSILPRWRCTAVPSLGTTSVRPR